MNKKLIVTALCLSAMTPMMAQNITGKVTDAKGEPLAFANVVLLNRTDSAFVKGAVSGEDGSFVSDTSCNGGIIKVTSVGYKTVCKDCEGENIGIIKMEEDSETLGEVVVKSSLPKTILKNGGRRQPLPDPYLRRQEQWSTCSTASLKYLPRMAASRSSDAVSLLSISMDDR